MSSDTVQIKCGQGLGRAIGNDGCVFVCARRARIFSGRLQCGKLKVAMLQCCKLLSCVCITITIYRTTETGNVTLAPFAFLWLAKDFRVCGTPYSPCSPLQRLLLLRLKQRPNALWNLCTVFFSNNSVCALCHCYWPGTALSCAGSVCRTTACNPLLSPCHASHCYQYQQKISSQGTAADGHITVPISVSAQIHSQLAAPILYAKLLS